MDSFRGRTSLPPSGSNSLRQSLMPNNNLDVQAPPGHHLLHSQQDFKSETQNPTVPRLRRVQVKLLDLPNEIILFLVEDLPDEALYALAFVCRRLHHLVLPFYLARKGFGPGSGQYLSLFNYNAWDVIRALNAALFRVKLRKLYVHVECGKETARLLGKVVVLRRVLERVEVVEEVVVVFERLRDSAEPLPISWLGTEEDEGRIAGGVDESTLMHLRRVLDTVVLCGRCLSLSVGGHVFPPSSDSHEELRLTLDEQLSKWHRHLRPCSSLSKNSLTSFALHSPSLFHPKFCLWTINTVNNSSITKISINQQWTTDGNLGNIDNWSLIVPHISMPALTDFSIDYCAIWTYDLVSFLRRHRSLQKLYIGHRVTNPGNSRLSFPKNALRNLTHLQAPPSWLTFMLSHKRCLPALSSCTILLHVFGTDKLTLSSTLDDPLMPITRRLRSLKEVHLSLFFGSPLSDWIHIDTRAETEDNTAIRVHSLITHIEACIRMYAVPRLVSHKMPRWLTQFPALRRFAIYALSGAGSFTPSQKELLLQGILDSCPGVAIDFGVVDEVDVVTRTRAP